MHIRQTDLVDAAARIGLDAEIGQKLWRALEESSAAGRETFGVSNTAYYFGGALIMGAMGYFMVSGWEQHSGSFILVVALGYMSVLGGLGFALWRNQATRRPGGILVAEAVATTALATYGLERLLGVEHHVAGSLFGNHGERMGMELATIGVGLVAISFIRFPFITLPIAFAGWFFAMDFASLYTGQEWPAWETEQRIALFFGIVMLGASLAVDRVTREDFAFWGYLFGSISFYVGLGILWKSDDQASLALFALCSFVVFALSVAIGRRVMMTFSVLAMAAYVAQLLWKFFPSPTALELLFIVTAVGLGVIAGGIWYQRNEASIRMMLLSSLPKKVLNVLPRSRA